MIPSTKNNDQQNEHSEHEFTPDKINSMELTEIFKLIFLHSPSDKCQEIRDILNGQEIREQIQAE